MKAPARLRVKQVRTASGLTLKITASTVSGADFYQVWKKGPKNKKFVKIGPREVGRTSTRVSFLDRTVKPGQVVRYEVQGIHSGGAPDYNVYYGPRSRWASALLPRSTRSVRQNATHIQVHPHSWAYGVAEQFSLRGRATLTHPKGHRVLNSHVRYVSTRPTVATVSASGVVTALKPGKATIRVIAHDGLERDLPVTVADYAHPAKFNATQIPILGPAIQRYWNAESTRLSGLTAGILAAGLLGPTSMGLDDQGTVTILSAGKRLPDSIIQQAATLLLDYDLPATITIDHRSVTYTVSDPDSGGRFRLVYSYDLRGQGIPAPHWLAFS